MAIVHRHRAWQVLAEIRSNFEGALLAGYFSLRIDMHLRRTRSPLRPMLFLALPQVVPAAP